MVDEFLQHMAALEQENRDLRARLESTGDETAPPEPAPTKVLIVGGDEAQSEVLREVLEGRGCETVTVATGADAVAACDGASFGMIILESKLGDGSGLDILQKLKDRAQEAEILIVVGFTSADTAVQALRLGASDFLLRPITQQDVGEKLSELLKRRQIKTQSRLYLNNLRNRYQNLLRDHFDDSDSDAT